MVYFEKDNILKHYAPMEGYFPIFTSFEAAKTFLEERLGGSFHIISIDKSIKSFVRYKGFMSRDLQEPQKGISAVIKEIKNLPLHLKKVCEKFQLPPWSCFVINPAGHREDSAYGLFNDLDENSCNVKGVSGKWNLNDKHIFKKTENIDCFDGSDTFYFYIFNYQFSDLEKSNCKKIDNIKNINIKDLSDTEIDEIIDLKLKEELKEYIIPNDIDNLTCDLIEEEKSFNDYKHEEQKKILNFFEELSQKWCLKYWETVSGETSETIYFEDFFSLAQYLINLEKHDLYYRINGKHDETSFGNIGFEKSYLGEKYEEDCSKRFYGIIKKICKNVILFGYNQSHAFDLALTANNLFKSLKISICIFIHDGLISFLPDSKSTEEDFYKEIGFPISIKSNLFDKLENQIHPESLELLIKKIGKKNINHLSQDSLLFLSTSLYNFEKLGKNKSFDYAPVSVQIVKSLEVEIRNLFKNILKKFKIDKGYNLSKDDAIILDFVNGHDEIVNLGYLTNILRKSKNYTSGPIKMVHEVIKNSNQVELISRKNIKLILTDVLNKFRNGGSHDKAISLETCEECVSKLIEEKEEIGLIIKYSKLNSELNN